MAVPQNTLYDNFVIENRVKDILETALDSIQFMKVDTDLVENAGMVKYINTYAYEGAVESVAEGEGNTTRGKVTFTEEEYRVKVKQQVFDYTDEQLMKDPLVREVGARGMASTMINDMNDDYFTEIAKTTTVLTDTKFNYDTIVDAIEKLQVEDEKGLFCLIGLDLKTAIRKDEDFKASRLGEILYSGQIGDISGVPVIVSKKVPENTCYVAFKDAVTLFTKQDIELKEVRKEEERINTDISRRVCIVALTDSTKAVKVTVTP